MKKRLGAVAIYPVTGALLMMELTIGCLQLPQSLSARRLRSRSF